ncbi:MAG: stage II sporulation protein M [Actinomycetota bacterium]
MDLDSFIDKYRPEWTHLESACARGSRGLSRTSGPELSAIVRLYQRVSAHLADVQTKYGDRRLEAYLNGLVARAHAAIYSATPRTLRGLMAIFGTRYRSALSRTGPFVVVAAALLVLVTAAAHLWVATSPEARAGLVPPFAREAVERGGAGGERLGLPPPDLLSTLILLNNLKVAFFAFALGIGLGVGTLYILVTNGIFIGTLAGAFQAAGHAWAFWALVLPHGFLEIIAICIASGAGLRLGWSIVDPGDRPRLRALAEESRDAVLVVIGVIPAFAAAALIEGFLTGSALPDALEIAVGAAVAAAYIAVPARPRNRGARP